MLKTTTQFINATIFAGFSRMFFQSFRFFGINSEWLILAEILINLAVLLWVIMEQAENRKYSLLDVITFRKKVFGVLPTQQVRKTPNTNSQEKLPIQLETFIVLIVYYKK